MKIISIADVPRTGDSDSLDVTFSQSEGGEITKRLLCSGCEQVVFGSPRWAGKLLMAMREAERDFAYRIFGAKEWRKHVGRMWGPVQAHELRMADQAVALRPDLFPGVNQESTL
jgi:hypothetical protein